MMTILYKSHSKIIYYLHETDYYPKYFKHTIDIQCGNKKNVPTDDKVLYITIKLLLNTINIL